MVHQLNELVGGDPRLLAAIGGGIALVLVVAYFLFRSWAASQSEQMDSELDRKAAVESEAVESGELLEMPPPDLKRSRFGAYGEVFQTWRYLKKRRKLLDRGYVQWLLIDDAYPWPRFVKPKMKGGGIPELKYKGDRYLFPKRAMLPDARKGFWTVVHRVGEADPINLRDPDELSIPSDELTEYLDTRLNMGPPSFLDRLDLDARTVMMYGIGLIVAYAIMQGSF